MNDIMTVDHGIVRFWKFSTHGAVNRTVAVACRPKILGSRFALDAEEKMEGHRGGVSMQEHTDTHIHYSHIKCVSAHFAGWSNYLVLHLSDNLSKRLIAHGCSQVR